MENYNEFLNLRESWQSLLQQCDHTIFSTWEYLATWWKYYGKTAKLKVLLALEREKILGIAPLMLSNQTSHFGNLHKIQFMGHGSDYADFIFPNENINYLVFLMRNLLQFSDWEIVELVGIPESSNTTKTLFNSQDRRSSELELTNWSSNYSISLSNSFKDFLKDLSRNVRKNLSRRMRRLKENYKVEFKTQNDFDSVKKAMEVFFNLHDNRWKSKGETGVFAVEENRDFHIDLAKTFNEKGWLSLYFLNVDDEPISAAYTYDYGPKKYGCLTGFNPEFGQFGIGNLIKIHIIEDCFKKKLNEYDLGRGSESYKTEWANRVRKNLALRATKGGLRMNVLSWINNFKNYL